MCNRARFDNEPETLRTRFSTMWETERPMDNRFNPKELVPFGRAWVIRDEDGLRGIDIMEWDVLGGQATRGGKKTAQTNVRNLKAPQWRNLTANPENRCLVPLTEFCEFTPNKFDLGDGKPPLSGQMWFGVPAQPVFAVAGFWQRTVTGQGFAMVTTEPNELVAQVHNAMILILAEQDWDRWLTGGYDDVVALQRPYPAELMTMRGPVFPTRRPGEK